MITIRILLSFFEDWAASKRYELAFCIAILKIFRQISKPMMIKTVFIFTLALQPALAAICPDLSGRYMDEENARIQIKQTACNQVVFISTSKESTIPLDGKLRLNETGQNQISYVSGTFNQDQIILEQIIKEKSVIGSEFIYRMILTYKFQDAETLLEETKLYNQTNKLIDYKTMTLLKIKSSN